MRLPSALALPVAALLVACDAGAPEPTPAPNAPAAEPVGTPVEAPAAAAPAPNAAAGGEASGAGGGPGLTVLADAPWRGCDAGEPGLVEAYPVLVDGRAVTIGARIRGGALAAAYRFEGADGPFPGQWRCRAAAAGAVDVQLQALLDGVTIGPMWRLESLQPGPGGQPPEPTALNLAALAAQGEWEAPADASANVLVGMARCRAPRGLPVTTGAFIVIAEEQPPVSPDDVRWAAVPASREDGGDRFYATLTWGSGDTQRATWLVAADGSGCAADDDVARRMEEFADGVPRNLPDGFRPDNVRDVERPSTVRDVQTRALTYVAAEERELEAVRAWVAFHEALRPYQPLGWWATPGAGGNQDVRFAFNVGDDARALTWTVNSETGETTPTSRLARLARAVQPRRLPGMGDASRRPRALDPAAVDAAVRRHATELRACFSRGRGVTGASLSWKVLWDGHPFDIVVDGMRAQDPVAHCLAAVVSEMEFPVFAGEPARASAQVGDAVVAE